jgi:hypothetical protein
MDQELKRNLDEMEGRLVGRLDRAAEAFATELGQLRTEMREGFDRVDRRLDLQGLMLSTNTKALGGLLENTVTLESEYRQTRKEIGELRQRVDKLEGGRAA